MLEIRSFQPLECLVLLAQANVYVNERMRRHVVVTGQACQFLEYLFGLSAAACRRERPCQRPESRWTPVADLHCLLQGSDRSVIVAGRYLHGPKLPQRPLIFGVIG